MKFEEYRKHDAVGLAALVANKDVTAEELLDVAIARAEAVNPALNGLIIPLYEQARDRARLALDGPLAGVPMLVKDLFQDMAGAPHYQGNKALKAAGFVAKEDAILVQRWKKAGLVPFGRTNTPEFGAKGITEPDAWGAARNPWNTEHTPGGSSGGSAAMVAAGVVPLAGANDGGGSIRIPAACCGLFGLKPGRGRTPWGPLFTDPMHGMAVNHVVTRTVRDSAMVLDHTQGPEVGSLFHIKPPKCAYMKELEAAPGKRRIGYSTTSPIGTPVDPEAVKAVEHAAQLLRDLGHEVEEAVPQLDMMQMSMDWLQVWFAQCAHTVDGVRKETGCGDDGFELDTLGMAAFGRALRADQYVACQDRWQQYMIALDTFLDRYDFWMSPTLAMPPAAIGAMATPKLQQQALKMVLKVGAEKLVMKTGLIEKMARENLKYTPFTQLANVTGVPAMSVPLHWCENGLPLGVQFTAGHGQEDKLLRLAVQLEQAQPWFDRVPDL